MDWVITVEKRKIWKTGKGTYVVSLPREWAAKQVRTNPEVVLFVSSNRIVVSTESEYKNPTGYVEMTYDDPVKLESQITAAYISGYVGLKLKIPERMTKSLQKLRDVPNRLYGTTLFHESNIDFVLSMSVVENEILNIVRRGYSLFHEIYKQTLELMEQLPTNTSDLESKQEDVVRNIELDSDRTFLYGRRLLNKALLFPDVSERVGLKDVRDAIEYNNIFSSFERLTDLQDEIFRLLIFLNARCLKEKNRANHFLLSGGYSFRDYYEDAHEIVKTSFESLESEEKALKLLSLRSGRASSDREFAEPYISKENREKISQLIKSNELYIDLLLRLEGKIWAMVGIATNIAEAGRNLNRPTETSEISQFFV